MHLFNAYYAALVVEQQHIDRFLCHADVFSYEEFAYIVKRCKLFSLHYLIALIVSRRFRQKLQIRRGMIRHALHLDKFVIIGMV